MSDTEHRMMLSDEAHTIAMARIDRAKLRAAIGTRWVIEGPDEPKRLGGIRVRVNPYLPEGLMAVEDRRGYLLYVIDLRGDHDPSCAPRTDP